MKGKMQGALTMAPLDVQQVFSVVVAGCSAAVVAVDVGIGVVVVAVVVVDVVVVVVVVGGGGLTQVLNGEAEDASKQVSPESQSPMCP